MSSLRRHGLLELSIHGQPEREYGVRFPGALIAWPRRPGSRVLRWSGALYGQAWLGPPPPSCQRASSR